MLTREQWNAMTPQAQWDLVLSLMDEVAAIEAAKFDVQPVRATVNINGAQRVIQDGDTIILRKNGHDSH